MVSILGSSPNHGRAFAEGGNYPLVPPVTPWAQAGPSGVSCGEISQTGTRAACGEQAPFQIKAGVSACTCAVLGVHGDTAMG